MTPGKSLPVINHTPSPLPPIYAAWLDTLLAGPIPPETKATCHDCVMCASGNQASAPTDRFYNPNTKCCTYLPELPNFLVGHILLDDDPAAAKGRAAIEARIEAAVAVTPFGLECPPAYSVLYAHQVSAFGRAESLRCPYYLHEDGGLCGIWKYRQSDCATFFCRYERGVMGQDFWRAVRKLLNQVDSDLAHWCMTELDLDPSALELVLTARRKVANGSLALDAGMLDGVANARTQRAIWGKWAGRERDFYRQSARLVQSFSWNEIAAIGGHELRSRARLAQEFYHQIMSHEIPARLKVGKFTVAEMGPDYFQAEVGSSSSYRSQLPSKLLRALPYFDGRPTAEALKQINEEEALQMTDRLMRHLVDCGILVSCEGAG